MSLLGKTPWARERFILCRRQFDMGSLFSWIMDAGISSHPLAHDLRFEIILLTSSVEHGSKKIVFK